MILIRGKLTLVSLFLLGLTCAFGEQPAECTEQTRVPTRWRGFYISGQLGAAWNSSHLEFTNANYFNTLGPLELGSKFDFKPDGFAGGGALGYNFQIDRLVLGLEVAALYTDLKKKRSSPFFPETDVYSYHHQWLAETKARIGYACKRLLPYIEGGWAGANVNLKLNDTFADVRSHSTKWTNGWVIGAGFDYKFVRHFSLGLNYDYIRMNYSHDKGSCSRCGTGMGFGEPIVDNHLRTQVLTARINWHL